MRTYSKEYCMNDYWLDYTREEMVKIEDCNLTQEQKEKLFKGEIVSAPDRGGSYTQYYKPIVVRDD